jgi:hypothetical protein
VGGACTRSASNLVRSQALLNLMNIDVCEVEDSGVQGCAQGSHVDVMQDNSNELTDELLYDDCRAFTRWTPSHMPEMCEMTKCMKRWEEELPETLASRGYILKGLAEGFQITDNSEDMDTCFRKNYRSAEQDISREIVEAQIQTEVSCGRYIICDEKPYVVSSLGAIPKKNNKVRLIHDLSRPAGGVNKLASDTSVSYSTIDDAVKMTKEGSYLAKLDLSTAYRSVPLHSDAFALTGIQWTFSGDSKMTYMYDCRLPFGAAKACSIFQTLSDAVVSIMKKRNYNVVSYIDDFLCVQDTYQECLDCYYCLVELLEGLGFVINFDKVDGPYQVMTFLGVSMDCAERTLSLPQDKLDATKLLIVRWLKKTKCQKKDLQSLIEHLNWAARVVYGGRTFMRDLISLLPRAREAHHFIRLNRAAKDNLKWWDAGLSIFHGFCPFITDVPLPSYCLATDACGVGGGAHFFEDWLYVNWKVDCPEMCEMNINVQELEMVHQAALRWADQWSGTHVLIRSDNASTVASINKGTSGSPEMLRVIQRLFWLSVEYNFKLTAKFLPGVDNILADRISRMSCCSHAFDLQYLLTNGTFQLIECKYHMSYPAFVILQELWRGNSTSC